MRKNFMDQAAELLPGLTLYKDEEMKRHTTFRVGGPADYYAVPCRTELPALLALARENGLTVSVIGNGSNLLVADRGVRGLVVEIGKNMGGIDCEGNIMRIGAGCLLSRAAAEAARQGLSGLEFASGIPGSVGGAVVMNAGAYGGEIKDVLVSATVLTREGTFLKLTAEELDLSYRHSLIPEKGYIAVEAEFCLTPEKREVIQEKMDELREKRIEKQPLEYPSAGSTFKRPAGYFAGKLIQDAGLRGCRVGDAQVSEKHCGFVINRGHASAADILTLIRDVQKRVKENEGVDLETEVRLLGQF